jgi:hypothetical protein
MPDWISWSEQPHACRCTNWVIHWDCYRYSHAGAASGAQQVSMATANTLQCQPIAWASCWGYGRQESLHTFCWICSACNQIHHGDSMTWSVISMFCSSCKACAHQSLTVQGRRGCCLVCACFRSHVCVVLFSVLNVMWVSIHSNKSCDGHLAEHVVFFLFLESMLIMETSVISKIL